LAESLLPVEIGGVIIMQKAMRGISTTITSILILVFGYTGLEKLMRFGDSRKAFLNQPMPNELEEVLAYAVPGVELLLALLLLFSVTRWWAYLGSILLLTVFITYVGLIWVGAFPRVPCNCAGLIDSMGWAAHFWMNLGLIGLAVWGMRLENLEIEKLED
jgi:uncharacterized membrane protein YphA (DoxX/SURF4 family)